MSDLIHYPPVRPEARGVVDGRFRRRPSGGDEGADRRTLAWMVERAQDGDREALAYLYMRYSGNVYGFVASIVHDEYEAEDVTQQVFTKLMGALSKYQAREVPFLAWMMTFSRNVAIDHLRRLRSIPCEDVRDAGATDRAPDPLDSVCVRDALRSLPAEQREVVLLRHVVGLSPCEIAGRMGRTESSVHGLHHRGRGTMRATLRQVGAAPAVVASSRRRPGPDLAQAALAGVR